LSGERHGNTFATDHATHSRAAWLDRRTVDMAVTITHYT